jgi:hypothetical protein
MEFITLKPVTDNSLSEFLEFWSKQYYYPKNEELYTKNINKPKFEVVDINELYKWKNGMTLSVKKQKSLEAKILSKLDIINDLKHQKVTDLNFFLEEFLDVSFVWKIFLLHLIKPNTYPIYDQHIHRAFNYIHVDQMFIQKAKQHEFYFKHYLNFIKFEEIKNLKKLDEAFFAFGQFINTNKYDTLLNY